MPNNDLEEFQKVVADAVGKTGTPAGHCYGCKEPFSDQNVHTRAGWQETKISGMCENCWDSMFSEDDQ